MLVTLDFKRIASTKSLTYKDKYYIIKLINLFDLNPVNFFCERMKIYGVLAFLELFI